MITGASEIGRVIGAAPGPTLVLIGGMHGNEPAGVAVCRRLLDRLRADATALRGEVVAFAANVGALAAGRRYLERDLNRQWTDVRVAFARAAVAAVALGAAEPDAETIALAQLADLLDGVFARARGPLYALDLHTTSATGVPFAIVGDAAADQAFAARFPLPGIVGMYARLEGILGQYLGARGCVTLAVEGGQHESASAVANLDAVVLVALTALGLCTAADLPAAAAAHDLLVRARGDLPQLIEVVSRHEVRPERGFRMEPGFINIQRTAAGTLLAREHDTEIRAPFDGLVLLPLYQPLGSDGFFYGRELTPSPSRDPGGRHHPVKCMNFLASWDQTRN